MTEDKKIEEMAKTLCGMALTEYCASGKCANPNCLVNAKALEKLYSAGYRKASDVARDIFEEMIELLSMRMGIKEVIAELKKKYTEGGE